MITIKKVSYDKLYFAEEDLIEEEDASEVYQVTNRLAGASKRDLNKSLSQWQLSAVILDSEFSKRLKALEWRKTAVNGENFEPAPGMLLISLRGYKDPFDVIEKMKFPFMYIEGELKTYGEHLT